MASTSCSDGNGGGEYGLSTQDLIEYGRDMYLFTVLTHIYINLLNLILILLNHLRVYAVLKNLLPLIVFLHKK